MSIYGELVIDDFQIDLANRDSIPDAIGWKIGIDGYRKVLVGICYFYLNLPPLVPGPIPTAANLLVGIIVTFPLGINMDPIVVHGY